MIWSADGAYAAVSMRLVLFTVVREETCLGVRQTAEDGSIYNHCSSPVPRFMPAPYTPMRRRLDIAKLCYKSTNLLLLANNSSDEYTKNDTHLSICMKEAQ